MQAHPQKGEGREGAANRRRLKERGGQSEEAARARESEGEREKGLEEVGGGRGECLSGIKK